MATPAGNQVIVALLDDSPSPGIQYVGTTGKKALEGTISVNDLSNATLLETTITNEVLRSRNSLDVDAIYSKLSSGQVVEIEGAAAREVWLRILLHNPEIWESVSKWASGTESISQDESSAGASPIMQTKEEQFLPPANVLHSDLWTLDDKLGYSLYARAIVEFIHSEKTNAPLTIGILAPWGQGKTTLMRMIQERLKEKANQQIKQSEDKKTEDQKAASFKDLWNWVNGKVRIDVVKLRYPTVWFNAWKYQSSEELWAGLAQSIISQLVEQIPTALEREKFWLALQLKRIDVGAIRSDIQKAVLDEWIPKLTVTFCISLGLFSLWMVGLLLQSSGMLINVGILKFGILPPIVAAIGSLATWLQSKKETLRKQLSGKFTKYVSKPDYDSKMGYFSQIEQDINRVFDLLIDPKRLEPPVVFIDDLDRCSPGKVAEAIEAVNLFLSGDFPPCYFVLGMDAQVVAASMETSYKDLNENLRGMTRNYGSLGWYFLDKFIQLPFFIPSMSDTNRKQYLGGLFSEGKKTDAAASQVEQKALNDVKQQIQMLQQIQNPPQAAKQIAGIVSNIANQTEQLRQNEPAKAAAVLEQVIEATAKVFMDNEEEMKQYLSRYAEYLGGSPRTLKRFANLFRFYRLSQWTRQMSGQKPADSQALVRWLVVMVCWPQLVRWIQWEAQTEFMSGVSSAHRAEFLENAFFDSPQHEDWMKKAEDWKMTKLSWCTDPRLFQFLKDRKNDGERLCGALEFGVW